MSRGLTAILMALLIGVCPTGPLNAQTGPGEYGQAPVPGQAYPPQAQYPQSGYPRSQQYPPYSEAQPGAMNAPIADQQHSVARVSIVQGDVNVKRGDNGQLTAAVVNAPLVARDHLETAPGSRAEVELDNANLVRLAPNTDVGFADLQYGRYQLQVGIGTIIFRTLRNSNSQVEVDTPSIAARPTGEGEYRISVFDNGTSQITVRSGRLDIFGPNGSQRIDPGHSVMVRGDASDPEFLSSYEIAHDQFDDWSGNRDQELLATRSYQYVSPDVGGAEDLDSYGKWVPSQYGQVWAPQPPAADWSPYSDGQWTWVDYYGWTWVDNAPWGWAPYHYGRWFWNTGFGWCWWPGARAARYFWSPALVGFFGLGGAGIGWAGLGWVALAPFELFRPWWGRGFGGGYGRYEGFALARNAEISRMYRNAAIRGGAMTAPFNRFGGPGQHFVAANRAQLSNASPFQGQMPVSPTQASLRFSNRQAFANPRVNVATNRQFFSRPQTYARPSGLGGFARQNSFPTNTNRAPAPSAGAGGGWQRFGAPGNSNTLRQNFSNGSESGWHRFGQPQPNVPRYYSAPRPNTNSFQYRSPNFNSPNVQRYSAPAPHFNAPAPHYSAPAPHYSTPSFHGGGGGGNRSGGGGGSSHGGGHSSSGGNHHR